MASDSYTRIPVPEGLADRLRDDKFGKETWEEYFNRVLDREFPDVTSGDNGFPTTDVKEAVRDVLRDELPEGALR